MNYPVPVYGVVAPAVRSKTVPIVICVVITLLIVAGIGVVAIGLGVGLGVGLTRRNSDSSSSSSSGSSTYSILSPPTVTCTYGGSLTCGCASTKPSFLSPRIVQGYTAVANSWPWIVALYINNNQIFCGGFLVGYQYVVTAAHCVNNIDVSTIQVYAGLQTLSSRSSAHMRTVSNKIVHPSYSTTDYTNDIAILKLTTSLDQVATIGLCCLTSDGSLPNVGDHAVIAGWGKATSSSLYVSDDLMQGVIEVQPDSASCSTPSTNAIQFCAGYSGTDSCFGDSGSPFMTSVNNSWTCTGIVSSGQGCGQNSYYTRVSPYIQFINNFMNS
jgi:secreted trypsin-like serine protease